MQESMHTHRELHFLMSYISPSRALVECGELALPRQSAHLSPGRGWAWVECLDHLCSEAFALPSHVERGEKQEKETSQVFPPGEEN